MKRLTVRGTLRVPGEKSISHRPLIFAALSRGKSRVQQHQMVYAALRGQMGGILHALALQTGVPET